jgi:hypothetical protein
VGPGVEDRALAAGEGEGAAEPDAQGTGAPPADEQRGDDGRREPELVEVVALRARRRLDGDLAGFAIERACLKLGARSTWMSRSDKLVNGFVCEPPVLAEPARTAWNRLLR